MRKPDVWAWRQKVEKEREKGREVVIGMDYLSLVV